MSKTNQQIVENCNELARKFYSSHGYDVKKGYRFDKATHPQELAMWEIAALAYEFIEGTDVQNALGELEQS